MSDGLPKLSVEVGERHVSPTRYGDAQCLACRTQTD